VPNFGTSQETSSNGLPRALQFSARFTFQVKPENTLRLTKKPCRFATSGHVNLGLRSFQAGT
jgi:hypothetical protein